MPWRCGVHVPPHGGLRQGRGVRALLFETGELLLLERFEFILRKGGLPDDLGDQTKGIGQVLPYGLDRTGRLPDGPPD